MSVKSKVIIAAIALLAAFAFGRYSAPAFRKTETETHESKDVEKHKKTTVVETEKPDGTKEKKTVVEEGSKRSSNKDARSSEEIRRDASKVTVSTLAAIHIFPGAYTSYGVSIMKPVLGPITLGAFYLTPGIIGASIGLTF